MAVRSCYYWLTECTKTHDEQDVGNPFKSFPERRFIQPMLWLLDHYPRPKIKKSRTMFQTWLIAGWAAHFGFEHPAVGVIFQSQKEEKAIHCVDCVKTLWENSLPSLQARWPLAKEMRLQPNIRLEMANKSRFLAIPGDPDQIRFEHPTIWIADEAAFMPRWSECYANALAAKCLKIVCLSSAYPGDFMNLFRESVPVDWGSIEP